MLPEGHSEDLLLFTIVSNAGLTIGADHDNNRRGRCLRVPRTRPLICIPRSRPVSNQTLVGLLQPPRQLGAVNESSVARWFQNGYPRRPGLCQHLYAVAPTNCRQELMVCRNALDGRKPIQRGHDTAGQIRQYRCPEAFHVPPKDLTSSRIAAKIANVNHAGEARHSNDLYRKSLCADHQRLVAGHGQHSPAVLNPFRTLSDPSLLLCSTTTVPQIYRPSVAVVDQLTIPVTESSLLLNKSQEVTLRQCAPPPWIDHSALTVLRY